MMLTAAAGGYLFVGLGIRAAEYLAIESSERASLTGGGE